MADAINYDMPALPAGSENFLALVNRCNTEKPRRRDITKLRKILKELPDLWKATGDLSAFAAQTVIDKGIQGSTLMMESIKAGHVAIREDLGFDTATPLEKLLIEHITLSWMRLQLTELHYTRATTGGGVTYECADHWDRRLTAAQRRYLRACETLARIRRLHLPVVQVNVGEKQVNVAGN